MAWTYFLELEELQKPSSSGSDQSHIANWIDIVEVFCSQEWPMEIYLVPPYGTTLIPSEDEKSQPVLTSSTEVSHARILALQEMEQAWQESEADYFSRSCVWSMRLNRGSSSWKMSQQSILEGLEKSPQKLPSEGMIVDGQLYPLEKLERVTLEKDGFSLPTMGANEYKGAGKKRYKGSKEYRGAKMAEGLRKKESDPIYLHPSFAEAAMMYPSMWTELKPWAMRWYQGK